MIGAGIDFVGSGICGLTVVPREPPSRIYGWFMSAAAVASGVWLLVQTWRIADRRPPRIVFTIVGGFITSRSIWGGLTAG